MLIGEPGSTTRGTVAGMMAAIDTAKAAGLDAVKFQYLSDAKKLMAQRNMKADETVEKNYDLIRWKFNLHEYWTHLLNHAHSLDILIGLSFYLPEDIREFYAHCGNKLDFVKISSFEARYTPLYEQLEKVQFSKLPVFISTGMLNQQEILTLIGIHEYKYRDTIPDRRYLHCISDYPITPEHYYTCQLNVLRQDWCNGFSDHTKNVLTGAIANTLGARTIEVHYMADPDLGKDTPDERVSLSAKQLRKYVKNIHLAETLTFSIEPNRRVYFGEVKNKIYCSLDKE